MKAAEQELYRKYLAGELRGEELVGFEERLGEDVVFREDFELYKEMEGFVEVRVEKGDALEVLRGVGRERGAGVKETSSDQIKSNKLFWFLIPVLIVSAIGAWLVNSKMQETRKHERMLAAYEYPPNRGTRSLDIAASKLDSAIHYFDLRRMEESEKLFLEILEQDSLHQDANRYMGHISFIRGEHKNSFKFLRQVKKLNRVDSFLILHW